MAYDTNNPVIEVTGDLTDFLDAPSPLFLCVWDPLFLNALQIVSIAAPPVAHA